MWGPVLTGQVSGMDAHDLSGLYGGHTGLVGRGRAGQGDPFLWLSLAWRCGQGFRSGYVDHDSLPSLRYATAIGALDGAGWFATGIDQMEKRASRSPTPPLIMNRMGSFNLLKTLFWGWFRRIIPDLRPIGRGKVTPCYPVLLDVLPMCYR